MNLDKKTSPTIGTYIGKRAKPDAPRTIVCFGTPRGGTSMVAGAIAGLGIFMGPDLPSNVEDPMFNPDVDKGLSFDAFKARLPQVIDERNAAHQVWGWKYPRAARYLEDALPKLRNPHLVLVYRDPVPATIRSKPENDRETYRELRRRLRMEMDNLLLAQKTKCPALMVSYERACTNPEGFIAQLADFLQVTPPEDLGPLLAFMEPGSYKQPVF
ncbi:MAG: sulfotransferase [Roseinatronobacter sp.]